MTKEEFNSTEFKAGMKAKYRHRTVRILGVDFEAGWVQLDYVVFCGDSAWVSYEEIDLVLGFWGETV